MDREAGDSEASGDLMLSDHRIGRDPDTQTFGENLGLFDPGLRHQDDEFVSSVAGDDVRLAAFLFEQASDTCKNEVAFEVSERVVDLFELIQVHQHNGEWPPETAKRVSIRR